MDSKQIREHLMANVCRVVFNKADGSSREMRCTLMQSEIPAAEYQSISESLRSETVPNLITVWDLGAAGFRSFRVDRMQSFTVETL